MLFNSLVFAVFLPSVVALFWLVPHRRRPLVLLAASYVFYGWWDWRFLSLILVSTVVDFSAARRIFATANAAARKRWVLLSVVVNLGILGFFKYWGFFVESASDLLSQLGADVSSPTLRILLPVGISFYTFQTLSYTIDVYRQRLEPEGAFSDFALFVAFFPQLVAGPIERATHLLPQLSRLPRRPREVAWGESGALIARGLFRKAVIADGLAPIVNSVFDDPAAFTGVSVAMGVLAFSLQIYGDFAGYTDIARGVAKLFGVDLIENFKVPYRATSFSDFWRRWHVSLSTWLRDYLYIPLGGNRASKASTYRNVMITMLLGGLWHGAGWGFVIWGGLHGLYLVIEKAMGESNRATPSLLVFAIVTLTWIPFRAPDLTTAVEAIQSFLSPLQGTQLRFAPVALAILGLATIAIDSSILAGRENPAAGLRAPVRGVAYGLALAAAILFVSPFEIPFIYFRF